LRDTQLVGGEDALGALVLAGGSLEAIEQRDRARADVAEMAAGVLVDGAQDRKLALDRPALESGRLLIGNDRATSAG
jgi:hypothetical protein